MHAVIDSKKIEEPEEKQETKKQIEEYEQKIRKLTVLACINFYDTHE